MRRFPTFKNRAGRAVDLPETRSRAAAALAGRGLVVAYLHGAYARGVAGKLSDVDVAVLFDRSVPKERYLERELALIADLEMLFEDEAIDLSVLNKAPLGFRFQVLKTGHPIYCSDEVLRVRFETRVMSEYYDFLPKELEYRALLFRRIKEGKLID